MRVLKSKSLMNLILGVLLALPLCAVASRVIYVQANKNAYQSYSEVVGTTTSQLNDGDAFNTGILYTFTWNGLMSGSTNNKIYVLDGNTNLVETYFPNETWKVDYFNPTYETTRTRLIVYDTNGNQHNCFNWQDTSLTFWAYAKDTSNVLSSNSTFNVFSNTYITSKLDNVFEYSISKFVEENDFGQMNLVTWFSGMFLSNNAHNNLYVKFINWYLNYAMLVTLVHFMFLVLMWFINYCRRIIDRSMNYDF